MLNLYPGARFPNMYNQNGSFFPHNSPPVFQQNTIRPPAPFQADAQLNSQHVFGSNPRFPTPSQPPPQFIPNLNFIRSTPPPNIIPPRPELNLPDWKNSAPPRDISYLSSQLSTPRASSDYSAPHQLNGTFNQPRNGFVNNMERFPSPSAQPNTYNQPLTTFPNPSSFDMQSRSEIRPGSFDQQSPIRPSAFQQQSHPNNRSGSFDQQSPMGPSAFQQQSRTNSRPGSFDQQSPNISSAFQQQSLANNRHGAFPQQSSNSNNFHYNNSNMGNNPFGSQPFNSFDKNPMRHKNYNKNNNRQNNWNGHAKGFNHIQGIKKEKEDKNSSLPFSCDPCDRSFGTENDLKTHLAEHIKCNSGNCQFEAHPKIVFLHKKMQHVAGYAEKINKLSSNEEIEKWRAERRRRFPTQENIARRQAEQAEKEARGEVMETPESTGKMKRKGDHQGKSNNYKRRRHGNRGRNQHYSLNFKPKTEEEASEPESSEDEPITKLAKFAGVNAVVSSETDEDSANTFSKGEEAVSKEKSSSLSELESGKGQAEEITVAENTLDVEERPINEIITINSSSNDSGSEKDSAAKETLADENISKEKQGLASSNLVVYDISDDDDDAPIELSSKGPDSQNLSSSQGTVEISADQLPSEKPVNDTQSAKKNNGTGPKRDQDMPRRKREFLPRKKEEPKRCAISLLKALYADDIKTERNKMFQCVRYIVQKNFFGIGE